MRLVTRGDVDGIMCAVLLKAIGLVEDMLLVEPREVQAGQVAIGGDDVVCNLPFAEGCGLWFDHHSSEEAPARHPAAFRGRYAAAPSAARLVFEHFRPDHPELDRFLPLLDVVDRFDSAQLTRGDVERPEPAMLLAFVLDPRTGLGVHHSYQVTSVQLAQRIPDLLLAHAVEDVLKVPFVKERVEDYHALNEEARRVFAEYQEVDGNVLVLDLRDCKWVPPANRFLLYTLPGTEQVTVSVRLSRASGGSSVVLQVGHNIFNRACRVDVGALMASYGGGGHRGAGACQVSPADADRVLAEIVARLRDA